MEIVYTPKSSKVPPYSTLLDKIRKGKASDFMDLFSIEERQSVVILARVSKREQSSNLQGQIRNLTLVVIQNKGVITPPILSYSHRGSGQDWLNILRTEVRSLALETNSVVLVATPDRLIRNRNYRSNHPTLCQAQASGFDLMDLKSALDGVRVMTYIHPDSSPTECKSLLTRWGLESYQDNEPGCRKRRKDKLLPSVEEFHTLGLSNREIGRLVGIHHLTVADWLKSLPG